jgi:hypothetical protein
LFISSLDKGNWWLRHLTIGLSSTPCRITLNDAA